MFEKRLQSFTYAVGMTFLILVALTVVTYVWFLLLISGAFNNIPAFGDMPALEMAKYLLNLKLFAVIVGAVFVTCGIWHSRLKRVIK